MKQVKIVRTDTVYGNFGQLFVNGFPCCLTLERRWVGNRVDISCIPDDRYICKRHNSPKFGETFRVCDVVGRSNILFHTGNVIDDSSGCILVGTYHAGFEGKPGIAQSKEAFRKFIKEIGDVDEFELEIISDINQLPF